MAGQSVNGTFVAFTTPDPGNYPGVLVLYGRLVGHWIHNIVGVPMYVVGMSGNILTLAVLLSSRHFRSKAFGILLVLLCLMDMGVLSTGLLRHCIRGLTWDRIEVRDRCQWCCKIQVYFTYVCLELSPWTLCLVTLERTLAVTCPLKTAYLCTKRRMFAAWLIIFVLVTSFNTVLIGKFKMDVMFPSQVAPDLNTTQALTTTIQSPQFTEFDTTWTTENVEVPRVSYYPCNFKRGDFFMTHVMPVVGVLLSYIIPGVAMLIMNVILYRGIRQAQQVRTSMRNSHDDNSAGSRLKSDTRMLVGISVLFILTNLPLAVYYISYHYWDVNAGTRKLLYTILLEISYINNAFNFAVYCFRGQKFRSALRDLVCCNRKLTGRQGDNDRRRDTRSGCSSTELTAIL